MVELIKSVVQSSSYKKKTDGTYIIFEFGENAD